MAKKKVVKKKKVTKKPVTVEDKLRSKYGPTTVIGGNPNKGKKYSPDNYLSSGSRRLNKILSGHHDYGIRRGRVVELYGPEGTGKTTLTFYFAIEAALRKVKTFFFDMENALDIFYVEHLFKKAGADIKYLTVLTPECCEDAFEMSWELVAEYPGSLFVYDSVTSMKPRAEMTGKMSESLMGLHARLMNKGLNRGTKLWGANKYNCWVIFINQIRKKIGVFFGNPETTTGGDSLNFYSTYRLDLRNPRGDKIIENVKSEVSDLDIDDDEEEDESKSKKKSTGVEIGNRVTVKTIKNKVAPPRQKTSIKIEYGEGIDQLDDLINFMADIELVKLKNKKAKSFTFGTKRKGKVVWYTRDKFQKLLDNKSTYKKLMQKIEDKAGSA